MRHKAVLACLAGAIWLVSFGFAESFEQAPTKVEEVRQARTEKAQPPEGKPQPSAKVAPKVEMKKAAPGKLSAINESKTPVADLLGAAAGVVMGSVDRLLGNAAAQPAPRKLVAPVAVRAGNVAMAQQLEQRYAARFRQLYRSELHFMRVVCQPTREQFGKIARAGDAELQATIKKFAELVAEQRQGRSRSQQTDPHKLLASGIVKNVRAHLSAEQAARYEKELEERAAARRNVVILNLLCGMDRKLILTAEQRDKLNAILDKNWNDSWNQVQLLMQGGEYFPAMPDDKILPVLTESQKKVWRGVQKGTVFFGGDLDVVQGIDVGEEVWSEPEKKK